MVNNMKSLMQILIGKIQMVLVGKQHELEKVCRV